MPEGHTIHRLARDHRRWFAGKRLRAASPQGRFAEGAQTLDGDRVRAVDAWGKHLLYSFEKEPRRLHVHLGLFGRFRHAKAFKEAPRPTTRLVMTTPAREVRLSGPTACELLDETACERLLARLGPDPLRQDADPEPFYARAARSRRAIGALLLDQSVIAGVGNVYRSELCFLCGVHPATPSREVRRVTLEQIWELSVELLARGVRLNRIVTVSPGDVGKASHRDLRRRERVHVYGRQRCLRCDGEVAAFELGSRTAYACTHCQGRR